MCGMPDFRIQTAWFGHWIPAFAGMTDISPLICDSLVAGTLPSGHRENRRLFSGGEGLASHRQVLYRKIIVIYYTNEAALRLGRRTPPGSSLFTLMDANSLILPF